MNSLSAAAILEKNRLYGTGAFIFLLEIALKGEYAETLRVCGDVDDINWGGQTWTPFPFELDEVGESSKGEITNLVVRVSNVTRILEYYLEKGNGGVGSEVIIRIVHSELLNEAALFTYSMFVIEVKTDNKWVTFTLGSENSILRRAPRGRMVKNFCNFRYKGQRCQYSGALSTCDKTLTDCRKHNNSSRFGGFPGVGSTAIYG